MKALGGASGQQAVEPTPRADRVELGRARGHDDLGCVGVEHPGRGPGDDRWPRIDRDDLVARGGVEQEDVLPGPVGLSPRRRPARTAADDDDVRLDSANGHLSHRGRCGQVRLRDDRQPWHVARWMAVHRKAGPGRNLAASDVGDAVDLGEAVAAVTREAERPPGAGRLSGTQDRDRNRVARQELDRLAVDDDVAGVG
jgi:hypothetical protein